MEDLNAVQTTYKTLNLDEKTLLFSMLIETVEVTNEKLMPLIQTFTENQEDPVKWRQTLDALRLEIESPRKRLFEHFIRLPGGLKFLLNLRTDVLSAQRQAPMDLSPLDHDLIDIFESWFQYGFLFLEEITLDSPLRQIELIMNGDMVHPMTSLEEMSHRLGRDRRCFALYHRAMPEEPVIFIEVALTKGMLRSIHEIIHPDEEQERSRKDTAIFYSINNTQNGLAGLGMGKLLIFQVVEHLKMEAPEIRNFATLSPMPGFWRRFLLPILENRSEHLETTFEDVEKVFDKKTRSMLESHYMNTGGVEDTPFQEILLHTFSDIRWAEDEALVKNLARPLTRLAHTYLAEEKDRAGRPLDPVGQFPPEQRCVAFHRQHQFRFDLVEAGARKKHEHDA